MPAKDKNSNMRGTKQIRRLKVIPEDRKKPWSSSNFLKAIQTR
jgi:hypothetical protein